MNYGQWLAYAQKQLRDAGISSARLDALLIMEYVLLRDRAQLLAHQEQTLTQHDLVKLNALLHRRLTHEPMAYILGISEFYGRSFVVSRDVLTPRPETEAMIELLCELSPQPTHVVDVGTGSGCIAITAALELPNITVIGTDNDPKCIDIAKLNADRLNAHVSFIVTDLIQNIDPDVLAGATILANLPYVPEDHPINSAAAHEPATAIFSPQEGLQHYKRLFDQIQAFDGSNGPLYIVCESLEPQHDPLNALASNYGWKLAKTSGLQQLFTRV